MDRDDYRKNFSRDLESQDSYDTRQAKQRASIKWLLSKAYNNRVPENLREPFYRDHEDQEHLKPQIVHNLANAELYCLAFANIYSDPNYHNLNHWGILQTLSRKGITVPDPPDGPLTETVLIQTTPIKLGAHMAVIEATMVLYAKEVVTPDRVVAAIHRFTHGHESPDFPQDFEDGLLLWVNHSQKALTQRIQMDLEKEGSDIRKAPHFPEVKDIQGLCDGAGLAALISFYCPEELPWTDIKIPYLPTVSDSVHNLCLVHEFSHHSLPFTVCHMMPEDVTYLRGNMKQNLIVLLADLFNVLEIHPVKCVRFPGYERNKELSKPTSIISSGIRKSHSSPHSDSYFRGSPDSLDRSDDRRSEDSFVVHRNRGVPTLSSVVTEDQSMSSRLRSSKEKTNQDTKADERGELNRAAGKPSNWEDQKRSSYAGRRSRRNSLSEDSQLTLENFGGSQENLYFLGRNPDKELTHVSGRLDCSSLSSSPSPSVPIRTSLQETRSSGVELIFAENESANSQPVQRRDSRKSPSPAPPVVVQNVPVRSSQQDARSNAIDRIFADNGYGIEKHDEEKTAKQETLVSLKNLIHSKQANDLHNDVIDGESNTRTAHFPDSKTEIDVTYNDDDSENYLKPQKSSLVNRKPGMQTNGNEKKTTFAALPNTTTWQQQKTANNINNLQEVPNIPVDDTSNMQLHNIRLKLEEKRRVIENEKRKMELLMSKQRQKLGKAAFLQAVTKDIKEDALSVERKWLDGSAPFIEERKTPDLENLDLEQYQNSIAQMNSSLKELDADMQRLSNQQSQLQGLADEFRLSQQHKQYTTLSNQHQPFVNQQQYANQVAINNYTNQNSKPTPNYSTYPNSTSPSKPISLSQLHQQTQNQNQFFLHDQQQTHRRTWSQQNQERTSWSQQAERSDRNVPQPFTLHDSKFTLHDSKLQNGGSHPTPSPRSVNTSPMHTFRPAPPPKPIVPPRQTPSTSNMYPAPLPTPSVDDMEPQSICFIGDGPDNNQGVKNINMGMSHINITSGSRTYRIPSPTRPSVIKNPFVQKSSSSSNRTLEETPTVPVDPIDDQPIEKGFYISFDDEAPPKRPKPPLRGKRSPKKERFATQVIDSPFEERDKEDQGNYSRPEITPRSVSNLRESVSNIEYSPESAPSLSHTRLEASPLVRRVNDNSRIERTPSREAEPISPSVGLIIGVESQPDPNAIDEMERKKEKILMLSLQRRQQQEELKARKEMEAAQRREIEKMKEEDKARKKEEEKARRAAIFEQYKLKKAIEEAEREGKVLDRSDLAKMNTPKLRNRTSTTPRPRPKTIHVESGGMEDGMLTPSRGKKGSTTNLADSPSDDGRGSSPSRVSSSNLGRRGSYKTSRGSSSDQDSIAFRYGDTDSGLGRATPPRRAPSPGITSGRHLTSPSGPGSLPPGLISKRRIFDDGASDISSNASSMMEYTGPRLYKQPATKSNRGIMLNAVEYCVFPGAVNKEAKRRVLEEVSRSESKYFLILFRDAGCQFRALYSYCPDTEEVMKLYGTGPKQVNDKMFDKFFKYNSGGKCFSQVHTKHLTVTIDAFTIHNSLWQGKKVNLPSKKDMALVI